MNSEESNFKRSDTLKSTAELSDTEEMEGLAERTNEPEIKGEEKSQKAEVERLQQEIEMKNKQIEEYLSMLQRIQAEFENYKKRVERERREYIDKANADLILQLLPILDNFERALRTESPDLESFKKGMDMIFSHIKKTLMKAGLSPINAEGEEFDPYYHECVLTAVGEFEDDTIIEELEKGYMFKNRVLRPSKVKVGKRGD